MLKKLNQKERISFKTLNFPAYEEIKMKITKKMGKMSNLPRDLQIGVWSEQSLKILQERYLLRDEKGEIIETPEELCWRVAWEAASAECCWGKTKKEIEEIAKDFYQLFINREFLPNSPTLMNAGTGNNLQYSACFVLPIEDSLIGIFDAIKYQALIHQTGGGTGFSFSRLRPSGSVVRSSSGTASGPVSFMRVFDAATNEVKQGGKRRGANMGILRVDHPDILEFIHCKEKSGITNFNISVGITDAFMKAYEENKEYNLIDPRKGEKKGSLSARKVFDEIVESAWKTGDPGLIFIDRINQGTANPVPDLGPIEATNPCVTGDTLISTKEGLIRMKEVVESHSKEGKRYGGNMGLTIDKRAIKADDLGTTDGRAIKFFDNGIKDTLRLSTKMGLELTGTLDHKVLTPNGWVELKDLKKGDKIFIQSGEGKFSENYDLPVSSKESFPKKWSKELGQALGWLVGDGWLRTGDKNCRVGWTFGKDDKEIMNSLREVVNQWYGFDIKAIKRLRNTYHLSYHGKSFVDFFLDLGIKPVKAEDKQVPESIFTAPKEAVIGFLQGLFTADGTVNFLPDRNSYVRLTSKSRSLLQNVQLLLLNLGIFSKIYNRSRPPRSGLFPYLNKQGERITYTTDGVLYELNISKESVLKFLSEIGFLQERHREKVKKFEGKGFYREKFTDEVLSIVPAGKQKVYDLTEEKSYTFITNGIVSLDCGEQPLYPYDACNLGSIFLNQFVIANGEKEIDWEKLKTTVWSAIRFLDNIIEVNPFPLAEIRQTVLGIRRVGLGVGGWADMLIKLRIPYDSEEALILAEKIMKFIQTEAIKASEELAKQRGSFPLWNQSIYKNKKPRRNSTVTTIAPTGSISIIANASSGIEPLFAVAYQHKVKDKNLDRTLTFFNPEFEEAAKDKGIWTDLVIEKVLEQGTIRNIKEIPKELREIFTTAHEIPFDWHIKMQVAFQKYTDNAVSKTINLKHSATTTEVKEAYLLAWQLGCKGITVFRDGSKEAQVLNLGIKDDEKKEPTLDRPFRVAGATYKLATPVGTAFVTINEDVGGEPLEVFINVGKAGSDLTAIAEALGRTISTALRFRGHLTPKERAKEIAHQLSGIGGRRSVGFGLNKIRSLPDAIASAISYHFGFKLNGKPEINFVNGEFKEQPSNLLTNRKAEAGAVADNPALAGHIRVNSSADPTLASAFLKEEDVPQGDICPTCGASSFVYEEGCSKCYACGHSEC